MRVKNNLICMCKNAFLPMVVYYLVHQMAAILFLGMVQNLGWEQDGNSLALCARMAAMLIAGMAVWPFYKKAMLSKNEHKNICDSKEDVMQEQTAKKMSVKDGVLIILAGAFFSLLLNYLFSVTGFTAGSESYNQVAQSQFSYALIPALVFYGVVAPMVEELVFRGIVYSSLKKSMSVVPAMVGSALLFGGIHGNIVQMLYGTLMGIMMAYLYEKKENLLAPILFHGAANAAVYLCL